MTEEQEEWVNKLKSKGWRMMSSREELIMRKPGETTRVKIYPNGSLIFFQKGRSYTYGV